MANVFSHIGVVGGDGRSGGRQSTAHSFENFLLLFRWPSLNFPWWVFLVGRERSEIPINTMLIWTCSFPIIFVIVDIEFRLFGYSLN